MMQRRTLLAGATLGGCAAVLKESIMSSPAAAATPEAFQSLKPSPRMPVLFLGHGSPMNAIEDNEFRRSWQALGTRFGTHWPRPQAILCISAHWLTRGWWLTAMDKPRTIHDFGGFPRALHEVQYPAPGDPALAQRIGELGRPVRITGTDEWGLDHGTWSVLKYMYPDADVPVVQLSLDGSLNAQAHYALAKQLLPLRDENVLIVSSGNIVHNLRTIRWQDGADPYPWATEFNDFFIAEMLAGRHENLIHWELKGGSAHLSIPTPEHYWPALYSLGLQLPGETVEVCTNGIEMGSISMLNFSVQ